MKIDFVMMWGHQGGVETLINSTSLYLIKHHWNVRIIQLSWAGFQWADNQIPFYTLTTGETGHDTDELINLLFHFWQEYGISDIAINVDSPIGSFIAKQAARCFAANSKTANILPIISWMHKDPIDYERRGLGSGWMLKYADAFFVINNNINNYIRKYLPNADIYPIKNPVNPDITLNKRTNTNTGSLNHLLYIGRLSPEKGIETVLNALTMPSCKKWELDIVGAGEAIYEERIHQMIANKKLDDRIRFHGWKENPWTDDYNSDALVIASKQEEMPLVAFEALSVGLPVIATPVGILPDYIIPGKNGYLFPIDDALSLVEILSLWSQNKLPTIKAYDCIDSVEEFSYDNAMNTFTNALDQCIKRYCPS